MTFTAKYIDVGNPEEMALVKLCQVHPRNPFIFRIECQMDGCCNQVWPAQMYDVRSFPTSLTDGASFACDGCVERWLREPDIPFDTVSFMRAHGATEEEIARWQAKCAEAAPEHVFLSIGE